MRKGLGLNYWAFVGAFFAICLFVTGILSQGQQTKRAREVLVWQQRIEELTDGIVSDSKSLDYSDRALYFALLARIWWRPDTAEARKYLKKSADMMLSDLDSDDKTGLLKKLKSSQKTLQIIASLDERLSQSLSEQIAKIIEAKGNYRKANADLFVMIALQVVDKNPRLAFDLGVKSLSYGNSYEINVLIYKLNLKDSRLGENLFQLSLAAAKRSLDSDFIAGLGNYLFVVRDGKTFSDTARRSYLELLADMISEAVFIEPERASRCKILPTITPLLARFDEYLPARSQVVRQQIDICLPFSHPFTSEIAKAELRGDEPKTVDEFLRAARDTNDRGLKGRYFYRAISILEKLKKFDEIISILDDMTEDERKAISEVAWNSWRIEYAFRSAHVYFEGKDMASVYRIISRTPKANRPYVRFRLVNKLSHVESREFILENLEEIRRELGSFEIPAKDAASSYLSLARLYLKIQPTESAGAFREAVKFINKTDNDNPDFLPEKDFAPLEDYVRMPFALLEVDEYAINSSLSDLSSRRSRVRLKLGLLESSLQKLADVKKRVELERKESKTTES